MTAGDALLRRLPRTTLVVGKGGVGKTTCAAALALRASRATPALVISTDPARALPTVLDADVAGEPTSVPYAPRLTARLLDAHALRARFMARWSATLATLLDRGTYLDDADIAPLVDTALPGSDEIFAALALAELLADERAADRVFVDTAPTGHTLRLLALPATFRALLRLFDAMQGKHRFMVRTLTRGYRADDVDAMLAELERLIGALERALADPGRVAAVVVTNPEPLVQRETRRLLAALAAREHPVAVAAIVWNATESPTPLEGDAANAPQYVVPRLGDWPVGRDGLTAWLAALREQKPGSARSASGRRAATAKRSSRAPAPRSPKRAAASPARLLRPLTIVAGKGGVGKTTVAAALALVAAREHRTLVVSTDPAPSLADALGQAVPDADTAVRGVPRLSARQMDAGAAFAALRDEYRERVDALFEGLIARGVDLAHDRAIARDLLALAPPGIDEVYALSRIADALFSDRHDFVIVDPAPTGHLIRLLEMPQLALAWSHQLMRLMLKYKDVTGLGETAREILEFARNLRALDALLRDAGRATVVLVALDEPVVIAETRRLAGAVRARGVAVAGVVTNRASGASALPVSGVPLHFQAPRVEPAPIGVAALRRWPRQWSATTVDDNSVR